jgi:hypothetical protein
MDGTFFSETELSLPLGRVLFRGVSNDLWVLSETVQYEPMSEYHSRPL